MSFSDAEERLINSVIAGEVARFQNDEAIKADLIRRLMLGVSLGDDRGVAPTPCGVRVEGATIMGRVDLKNARGKNDTYMPGLALENCVIADGIDISYAQLGALSIEKSRIRDLCAVRAVIEGEMVANDIRPASDEGFCFLNLHSLHVDGDVQVRRAILRETPELDAYNYDQFALDLRKATVNGNVYVRYFNCHGTVNLEQAVIEGNFTARNGVIKPRHGQSVAIRAEGLVVKNAFALRSEKKKPKEEEGFRAYGKIDLSRTVLGAALFDGGYIDASLVLGDALDMTGSQIVGGIYFRNKCQIIGGIKLEDVTLGGNFEAHEADFSNGFRGKGLTVGGELDLSGVQTHDAWIRLSDARIGNVLKTGDMAAKLDLSRASAKTLDDKGQLEGKHELYLDGFVYERLEDPASKNEKKISEVYDVRMKWLSRQGGSYDYCKKHWHWLSGYPPVHVNKTDFRPQPFMQLAHVLTSVGYENEARRVLLAKQWIECDHAGISTIALWPFGAFFGFGYSSKRASMTLLLYFILGWLGVSAAQSLDLLTYDIQPVAAYASIDNKPVLAITNSGSTEQLCTNLDTFGYALDLMVPLVDLHIEGKCTITSRPQMPKTIKLPFKQIDTLSRLFGLRNNINLQDISIPINNVPVWKFLHTAYAMVGWLVVSLSILTFSGLLRQKEHVS